MRSCCSTRVHGRGHGRGRGHRQDRQSRYGCYRRDRRQSCYVRTCTH